MTAWAWLVVGIVAGVFQVSAQWWTVNRLQPDTPGAAAWWTVAAALGRLTVMAALLLVALAYSIAAGLLVFLGWWLVRWPLIIWLHR